MALSGDKLHQLLLRISAATIANQAIIKCSLSGIPLTADNAILFVGDFFDPADEDFAELIPEIETALTSVIATMPVASA